jgi:hypothetical protein
VDNQKCIYPNMTDAMEKYRIPIERVATAINRKVEVAQKKLAGTSPLYIGEAIRLQETVFPELPIKVLYSTSKKGVAI